MQHKVTHYTPCYASHKPLSVAGGKLLGGSCIEPAEGYDIYVGLDWAMRRDPRYPWNDPSTSQVVEVYFPITDGGIPKDVVEFKKMVGWLIDQLGLGKAVHIGCIGGHGRTGLLIAALVSHVDGIGSSAAEWVRMHHCKQAIETTKQAKFLREHFGVAELTGSQNYEFDKQHDWAGYEYAPLPGKAIWAFDND